MTPRQSAEEQIRASYDETPYPSGAQRYTHPNLLATLGILHGLEPAPPERCRVLEVGCADGGNLLPMAHALPASTFLGIDLSPRQIEDGRRRVAELGLGNLELRTQSLLDVDDSFGLFDYVIVHGVFSWVPREMQEGILALCRARLAPHGIAYVSFNAYPGWHRLAMVREMLLYHTRAAGDAAERVTQAEEWLDFLTSATQTGDDAHSVFLRETRELLAKLEGRQSYVVHDFLEDTNEPLYFHQFMARAERYGLAFLADADYATRAGNLPPAVARRLEALTSGRLEREQYLDFATNRSFRRVLLCHGERAVSCDMMPERVRRLYAASSARPEPGDAPSPKTAFRVLDGRSFSTSHPLARALFMTSDSSTSTTNP